MNSEMQVLRLPAFVTPESLAQMLGWANSVKRLVRQAAERAAPYMGWTLSEDGDCYEDLLDLLTRPGGGAHLRRIVESGDKEGRTLRRAIWRKALLVPGFKDDESCTPMETLLDLGEEGLAAWMTFDLLSAIEPEEDIAETLLNWFCQEKRLVSALGPFVTDWSRAFGRPLEVEFEEDLSDDVDDPAVAQAGGAEANELRTLWRAELDRLVSALTSLPDLDPSAGAILAAAADRLHDLEERAKAERERLEAEAAQEAERLLEALLSRMRSERSPGEWAQQLRDALSGARGDRRRLALVRPISDWFDAAIVAFNETQAAFTTAFAALEADDKKENQEALNRATDRRREVRTTAAATAARWLDDLGRAEDAGPAADAADGEGEGEGEETPVASAVAKTVVQNPVAPADASPRDRLDGEPVAADMDAGSYGDGSPSEAPAVVLLTDERPQVQIKERNTAVTPTLTAPAPDATQPDAASHPSLAEGDQPSEPALAEVRGPATELASATDSALVRQYSLLMENALEQGRYGFAADVQRALETSTEPGSVTLPSVVLEALCIGAALNPERVEPVGIRYERLAPRILSALDGVAAPDASTRLLAIGGALKPALFCSPSSAGEVLREAEKGVPPLHALAEFVITELPKRGGVLDLRDLLTSRVAGPDPAAMLQTTREEVIATADRAATRTLLFQRATAIWRDLFSGGAVAEAIAAIRQRSARAAVLSEKAATWLAEQLENKAHALDKAKRTRKDEPLVGRALESLLGEMEGLQERLARFATLSRQLESTRESHGEETRRLLLDAVRNARFALGRSPLVGAAPAPVRVTLRILEEVAALFEGNQISELSLPVDLLRFQDLLLVEPYPASARGDELLAEDARHILNCAEPILSGEKSCENAFEGLLAAGWFEPARDAAACLEARGSDGEALRRKIRAAELERVDDLEGRVNALRARVDDLLGADSEGRMPPRLSLQLDQIAGIMPAPEETDPQLEGIDLRRIDQDLCRITQEVDDEAKFLLEPLLAEIDDLETEGRDVTLMRALADRQEFTALRDAIDGARAGADVDLSSGASELLEAFAKKFLSPVFQQGDPALRSTVELAQAARNHAHHDVVDFSAMTTEDAAVAADLLEAWRKIKSAGGDAVMPALRDLLTQLRFTEPRIVKDKERPVAGGRRYGVTFRATSNRADVPAPAFGSGSGGQMNVFIMEPLANGRDMHALLDAVGDSSMTPALFIVKGVMAPDRRLDFMRQARRASKHSCGLIDESSIIFLASQTGRSRGNTFAVALPCGGLQPYSDAPGITAPEMFFGRREELDEIWQPRGSCLVYGGRQLGKTALLQQVRIRHDNSASQLVLYCNLQGKRELWPILADALRQTRVVAPRSNGYVAVGAAVRDWLKEDSGRRVLILADEADTYFEAEMADTYPSLTQVRDLMVDTARRFKIVFAGLHNVQRLARDPNSPVLHFGQPVQVGPLFGRDLGEAREMVVAPMAACGMVFEDQTLPNRILSALGFYPSLIQTFGMTLVDRINKNFSQRARTGSLLPISVTARDVEDALEDSNFKASVRDKFRKTLSLDERYRLITLAMLQRSLERRELSATAPGLTDVEIQSLARSWWPQGFEEDRTLDAFQGLLQEMEGLGVLVRSGDSYAIRSSRIAAMLGGHEQIQQELLDLSNEPAPVALDPGALRRIDPATGKPEPLTLRQESQMMPAAVNEAHVVLASPALGIGAISNSLERIGADDVHVVIRPYRNVRHAEALLEEELKEVRSRGRHLFVLTGPWLGRELIDCALGVKKVRVSPSRGVHVLIVPSEIDWSDAMAGATASELWGARIVALSTLGRSGLAQWLRSRGASDAPGVVEELRRLTGGFPAFLNGSDGDLLVAARDAFELRASDPVTLDALGLRDERMRHAARLVGDFADDDPAEVLSEMGYGDAEPMIAALRRLAVLEDYGGIRSEGGCRLNPFVAAVLARQS